LDPTQRVLRGHIDYSIVKFCHDARDGYLLKYINDVEMERAITAIHAIVDQAKTQDPTINTDTLWNMSQKSLDRRPVNEIGCHNMLNRLFEISPKPAILIEKP
jgi:hypothetical protein